MKARRSRRLLLLIASVLPSVALAASAPSDGSMATSLLMSPSQYRQTIADIFGHSIRIDGRFEPVEGA